MEKYRVEYVCADITEIIKSTDEFLTAELLERDYGVFAASYGAKIRLVDNGTNEILAIFKSKIERYTVEHAHWVDGSGWSYTETIGNIDEFLTEKELELDYGDYADSYGDEIRLIDKETDKIVAKFENV